MNENVPFHWMNASVILCLGSISHHKMMFSRTQNNLYYRVYFCAENDHNKTGLSIVHVPKI
jgi:hypothetical protein